MITPVECLEPHQLSRTSSRGSWGWLQEPLQQSFRFLRMSHCYGFPEEATSLERGVPCILSHLDASGGHEEICEVDRE